MNRIINRIIKFRAWEPENKKFIDTAELLSLPISYFVQGIPNVSGGYILMQFTGLTDKNGKEIYEGDIVKESEVDVSSRAVVEWEENMFVRRWLPLDGVESFSVSLLDSVEYFEVIGNIYENPELLK